MELKRVIKERKAAFFSTDALIALLIIFFIILMARPLSNYFQPDSDIHSDVLVALSTLRVSELDDASVQAMISNGIIRDPNRTLLEQIGEFYVYNLTRARALAQIALEELNTTENIGIWYGTYPVFDLIYSKNSTPYENARDIDVAREVISGIQAGENISGFSARAALSSDYRTNYFYFGGYVGDGNVSVLIDYRGNITGEAEVELAINTTNGVFEFLVNGVSQGTFATSPSPYEPVHYAFNTSAFSSGFNLLEFKGRNLYIAGGFVKIAYRGEVQLGSKNNTYYFPGINGLINLYDGFFVPQNLTSIDIRLHMNSNYTILLNLGNVTVYNGTTNGEQNITLNNSFLRSRLNYSQLEGKTIPLRLGLENASYLGIVQQIDVFSVTDLSGSMDDNCWGCNEITCTPYAQCHDANGCKICDAKSADALLINYILNTTGNRVGLVGYETTASISDYHALSNNSASLISEISGWDADGNTCICCGINRAVQGFLQARVARNSSKGRMIVYYDFNSSVGATVIDRSGEGNNGSVFGNPTSAAGISNNSFNLDGIGDYISVPDVFEGNNGTISLWIDPDDGTERVIFDASSATRDFYANLDNRRDISFIYQDSGGTTFNDIHWRANSIEDTGWHHLAFVWKYGGSSPSGELYYDGNLVDSDVNIAGNISDFLGLLIGGARAGGSPIASEFDGKIDEFRLYTKALNLSEIRGLNDTTPVCGNHITEVGEICDGDGKWCSSGGNEGFRSCSPGCNGFSVCNTTAVCGDNVIETGEECDDGNSNGGDGCSANCTLEDRFESIVVMSDGQANEQCSEQGTGDAADDAILAAQQACTNYGIVIYSVGFGAGVDEATLTSIANNGCGGQYFYSSATNLTEVYRQIAQVIMTQYIEQTLSTGSLNINTRLYPDSYIKFNYTELQYPYGLIVTAESLFDDDKGGSFFIPDGSIPLLTNVVSYSGPRWTSNVFLNNQSIFNLDNYNSKYIFLGDPYRVTSMDSIVTIGTNYANVTTGVSVTNKSQGSEFNKIIFTIARNVSSYSEIVGLASGCIWDVEMEDGSFARNLRIPLSYTGSDRCNYNETAFVPIPPPGEYGIIANDFDAYQLAVLSLLRQLDLDHDGKSDVVFTAQDLAINLDEFSGIPFAYYTEVEVRRWA